MGKSPRSFSIDDDLDELLAERDDINASAVVNRFLREYVAGGRGTEAALETRISQLDEEISDLEKQLNRKKRERDRLERTLKNRQDSVNKTVEEVVNKVKQGLFPRDNIEPENDAIQRWAADAGIPADDFAERVQMRVDA